jgi:hypothetical protein
MHGLIIAIIIVILIVGLVKLTIWIMAGHFLDFLAIIFIGGSAVFLSIFGYKVIKANG